MTRKRTIATVAALGGFTAAIALLSGLQSAKADELSDLRANQQLLEQRLDQLAQAPISPVGGLYPGGAPAPTAGAGIVGGSFPRSFLIPGTDTSIRVGGEIRINALYWINGANPNAFSTNTGSTGTLNTIPLSESGPPRRRSHSSFQLSPQQSKVNFETRTPTAWGEARTFMEFDWAGTPAASQRVLAISNNLNTRLRFAYATLGGFLGGQANSNFSDPDAGLETLSFGAAVGAAGVTRIPQVRYTMPLAPWGIPGAFSVSAEAPETEIWTPAGGVFGTFPSTAVAGNPLKTPSPDFTAAWYIPQPWGHLDFSAVIRPALQVKDGLFVDRMYTGYGFNISGDVKPRWFGWNNDYIVWSFTAGNGIGRYIGAGSGNGTIGLVSNYTPALAATAAGANSIIIKPVVSWGGSLGYQHRWTPTLRSNIGFGIYHEDINMLNGVVCSGSSSAAAAAARATGAGGCGLNKELINPTVNLIWAPVPFADIGVEYTWGHRLTVGNARGDQNVLLSRFRVRF
jgi:hypothetical protein